MRIHQDAISSCLDEKSRVIAFDRRNACGRPEKSQAEHCGQIPSFLVFADGPQAKRLSMRRI